MVSFLQCTAICGEAGMAFSFFMRTVFSILMQQSFPMSQYCTRTAIKIFIFSSLRISHTVCWSHPTPFLPSQHCKLFFLNSSSQYVHHILLGYPQVHNQPIRDLVLNPLTSPLPHSFQLPIAPQLGWCSTPPSVPMLALCLAQACSSLMPVAIVTMVPTCSTHVGEQTQLTCSHRSCGFSSLFTPLPRWSLSFGRSWCGVDIPLGTEIEDDPPCMHRFLCSS